MSNRIKSLVMAIRRKRSRCIDSYLHIDTMSIPSLDDRVSQFGDSVHYEPPDYILLYLSTRCVKLLSDDTVYEIGCGMGRVLCYFMRHKVRKVVGIELCPELARSAIQNAYRLRGAKSPVEVRIQDAAESSYDDGTIYFMFNPFGADTLVRVLELIHESLIQRPRNICIVYMNPVHEEVLNQVGWLRCVRRIKQFGFRSETTIWENTDAK